MLLAGEPTAPLGSERALTVLSRLQQMAEHSKTAIIVVTHDEKIIPTFRRISRMRDGKTVEETLRGKRLEITARLLDQVWPGNRDAPPPIRLIAVAMRWPTPVTRRAAGHGDRRADIVYPSSHRDFANLPLLVCLVFLAGVPVVT